MHSLRTLGTTGFLLLAFTALSVADFDGPSYPAPNDISSNTSLVATAWRNVSSTIATYLSSSDANVAAMKNVTFSLGMFSLHDPAAIDKLQYHHTAPEIANAPNGTHSVNGNSIYRIASVTKLFTVLSGLLELNLTEWERPLTDIFPALAQEAMANANSASSIYTVQWDKVTPRALAAQIAGVPRDGFPSLNELALQAIEAAATVTNETASTIVANLGLPALDAQDPLSDPPCFKSEVLNGTCDVPGYIAGQANRPPTFGPWTTPAYANNGFSLLGLSIEAMTGKPFAQICNESIFMPLGMSSSSATAPPVSEWYRSVIPGDPAAAFVVDAGVFTASGGLLSTTEDLARFGVGILNSTLLDSDETRRWMKPVSHTARLGYSVGAPWEIIRFTLPGTGKVTDLYTKLGDSGAYSAELVLLPDYGVGFSILAATQAAGRVHIVSVLADLISQTVIPALDKQAALDAGENFAGTYASPVLQYPDGSNAPLNSTLTLALNQSDGAAPGLYLTSWISNGTDQLSKVLPPTTGTTGPFRLLPSILDSEGGAAAFRLVGSDDAPTVVPPDAALFSGPAAELADWILVDSLTYGGIGLSLFVFDLDASGRASAVSPAAYRVKLSRTTKACGAADR